MLKLKDCVITHFEDDCYIYQSGTTYTPDLYDESEFILTIYFDDNTQHEVNCEGLPYAYLFEIILFNIDKVKGMTKDGFINYLHDQLERYSNGRLH